MTNVFLLQTWKQGPGCWTKHPRSPSWEGTGLGLGPTGWPSEGSPTALFPPAPAPGVMRPGGRGLTQPSEGWHTSSAPYTRPEGPAVPGVPLLLGPAGISTPHHALAFLGTFQVLVQAWNDTCGQVSPACWAVFNTDVFINLGPLQDGSSAPSNNSGSFSPSGLITAR